MITIKPLGLAVKQFLNKKNMSYQDLSNRTKISKPYLAEIITKNRVPSKEKIEKIAEVLELDPYYFREYRLILLNEYIEKNPYLLAYEKFDDLKNSVDFSYSIRKIVQLLDRNDEYCRYLNEDERKRAEEYEEYVFTQSKLYKFFIEALDEVKYENLTTEDIEVVNKIVIRLSEKKEDK